MADRCRAAGPLRGDDRLRLCGQYRRWAAVDCGRFGEARIRAAANRYRECVRTREGGRTRVASRPGRPARRSRVRAGGGSPAVEPALAPSRQLTVFMSMLPLNRARVERSIAIARLVFREFRVTLPPFASWTTSDWERSEEHTSELQ